MNEILKNCSLENRPTRYLRARKKKIHRSQIRNQLDGLAEEWRILDSLSIAHKMPDNFTLDTKQKGANYYRKTTNPSEAIIRYNDLINHASARNNDYYLIEGLIALGFQYIRKDDYYKGIDSYLKALEIEGDHAHRVYHTLPNVYRKVEDWDKVLEYGLKGLEHAQKNDDFKNEIFALMQLGYAHMKKENWNDSQVYNQKAWDLSKKKKYRRKKASSSIFKVYAKPRRKRVGMKKRRRKIVNLSFSFSRKENKKTTTKNKLLRFSSLKKGQICPPNGRCVWFPSTSVSRHVINDILTEEEEEEISG